MCFSLYNLEQYSKKTATHTIKFAVKVLSRHAKEDSTSIYDQGLHLVEILCWKLTRSSFHPQNNQRNLSFAFGLFALRSGEQ